MRDRVNHLEYYINDFLNCLSEYNILNIPENMVMLYYCRGLLNGVFKSFSFFGLRVKNISISD